MNQHSPPLPRLLVVASLVLLAACGKGKDTDDGTTQPPPPTPVATEKFAEEYANALCAREQRCGSLAPYLVDQCKADTYERIGATDVQKAVAAGRLTYDADKARACVDGIQNTPCLSASISDEVQATCYAALQGTVQKGAECSFLFECAVGSCQLSDEGTCPGVCPTEEQVSGLGQPCSNFRYPKCDERAGLRCSGGTCVQPAGQGADCIDNNGCTSGFVCIYKDGAEMGTCTPLAKEGSGCSEDASCAAGLFCTGDNICSPRLAEGKPCGLAPDDIDAALRGSECQEGLTCKGSALDTEGNPIAGTCTKVSAEGGACQAAPENTQIFLTGCQDGLDCNGGTCALPPVSGPCPQSGCRYGVAYCDDETNTCQLLRQLGETCTIPPQCASRNCGPDGTCIAAEVLYCHE